MKTLVSPIQPFFKAVEFIITLVFFRILLQHFRRHDPSNSEEFEMMENLFDVLCSALLLPANRDRFLKVRFNDKSKYCYIRNSTTVEREASPNLL